MLETLKVALHERNSFDLIYLFYYSQNYSFLFHFRNHAGLCFYFHTQSKKGTLSGERDKEETYLSKGCRSSKKAQKCFQDHEKSHCYKIAASCRCTQSHDVGKLIDRNLSGSKRNIRAHFIVVVNCLTYLTRQGIVIQGTQREDNFTHLLKLMGTKDSTITNKLQQTSQKIIHQDLQNELLDIMAKQVLPKNLERIREHHFYSIICDERTDCSNREQLSFNIWNG